MLIFWVGDGNEDGRGYFLVRPTGGWSINLLVESPHSVFDGAGSCAGEVFRDTGARAFMMAGTHRCANAGNTTCSGKTSVCTGKSDPYKESDMAHVQDSFFQVRDCS